MAKLFYVLGASGAGKDSIMDALRSVFCDQLMVAHRYITRPASAGSENHIALSGEEFSLRIQRNLFTMHWHANGYCYGVGREVDYWLSEGLNVMVNGSRAYLPTAKQKYGSRLQVVWITVSPDILQQRLIKRGRENRTEIVQRLERAVQYDEVRPNDAILLNNSGTLQETVAQFSRQMDNQPNARLFG
ncbi:ribose 1,5-bisphosphokinase [Vibrio genomosp. F10]|uniref:Ribose 1,5-bisphosphate phosphokinase PhnN n=1 Tax=Vibrio genomosp. F10 TaxID=723171 RepID=A0A1B9QVQ5_9VIBR|nr:ribose 1,5-bisphosphokinase [Vibrio genomosp. F10]OCH73271.1 phosphonate metabolism protein/1,5-bisphosphokinase (PRPP-forming) PhnN [Vibrio genomosp. F10]